jgi:hypothetical protein
MSEYTGPRTPQPPATHAALDGLGVLSTERPPVDPLDVLRRIVAWRDSVHAGRVVRGAELEALIEEARGLLPTGGTPCATCSGLDMSNIAGWSCADCGRTDGVLGTFKEHSDGR